MKLIISKLLNF